MPVALGINCAHDASVAVCSPEGILCAVQEERLSRIKHHYGFPRLALEAALKFTGIQPSDIDAVAFPSHHVFFPEHRNHLVVTAAGDVLSPQLARRRGGWKGAVRGAIDALGLTSLELRLQRARQLPGLRARWGEFIDRHFSRHADYLADLGLSHGRAMHYYVAHHRAHAASAFRLSGLEEACVITLDGKGDGLSGTIYHGRPDGSMALLRSSRAADSLGAFYQAATEALGFIPVDGEYKTMGLAALGKAGAHPSPFEGMVQVEDGTLRSTRSWSYRNFNLHNPERRVPNPLSSVAETEWFKTQLQGRSQEEFAFLVQEHCEGNMLDYARAALRLTTSHHLAAAGGVMLNVKANSLIRDRLEPAAFFVFPDAADSGLAAGAALEALYHMGAVRQVPFRLPYLGPTVPESDIHQAIERYRRSHGVVIEDGSPPAVAARLERGDVLGTFQGRLEMGPRALGNRSVLADPRNTVTKDRINGMLKGREWFVPFAPAVLREDAHLYWDGPIDYRYMTFAVRATPFAARTVPAVVHVDGTMRPQVVTPDFPPWLHQVLVEFKRRTGVGVLLNTSFNRHGLPIVGSPQDALDHLINGWVDGVVLDRWLVTLPRP